MAFQRLLVGDGQELGPEYQSVLDPLLALSYAAALTSRIRLGAAVINLPYLAPAYLAKQASTLDVLSRGRAEIGLGTGWSEPEFRATGSDPNPRGRRTEEYLAILKSLFVDDVASFDDRFPLSGDWEQIRAGAQLYAEAGVTELFYDLNWDPLVGGGATELGPAVARAEEILTALAPEA